VVIQLTDGGWPLARHDEAMEPVRLLLADDHLMVTEALAASLAAVPDLLVTGRCAATDPHLAEIVQGMRTDVIVIDTEPFGTEIGDKLAQLLAARPQLSVVVLSADREVSHAVTAARAGAAAWVTKDQDTAMFESVVRGAANGHSWFPPEMLGAILRQLRAELGRPAGQRGEPAGAGADLRLLKGRPRQGSRPAGSG
jgi:NarL family two-component system response regulator LiaR